MKKKLTVTIMYISLVIAIIISLMFLIFILFNSKSGNKSVFTIVSPSMEPAIKVYDVIILEKIKDEESIKKDDIITFYSDYIDSRGYSVTHRVIDIYKEDGKLHFITQGDNNLVPDDGSVTFDNILGRVKHIIPKLGKVEFFITSKLGWILLILIPCLIILIYDFIKILIFLIKNKGGKIY